MVATYQYKQPSRFNAVSIFLLLLLAVAGYLGYCAWPLASLHANIKTEMQDGLSQLYRANLVPEPVASQEVTKLKGRLIANLKKLGLEGKPFDVFVKRDKKEVSIETRYTTKFVLVGIGKEYKVAMNPIVKTDAARVQWE